MTACVNLGLIFTFQEPFYVPCRWERGDQIADEDTSILGTWRFYFPSKAENEAMAEWKRNRRTPKMFMSPPHRGQTHTLFSLLLS